MGSWAIALLRFAEMRDDGQRRVSLLGQPRARCRAACDWTRCRAACGWARCRAACGWTPFFWVATVTSVVTLTITVSATVSILRMWSGTDATLIDTQVHPDAGSLDCTGVYSFYPKDSPWFERCATARPRRACALNATYVVRELFGACVLGSREPLAYLVEDPTVHEWGAVQARLPSAWTASAVLVLALVSVVECGRGAPSVRAALSCLTSPFARASRRPAGPLARS